MTNSCFILQEILTEPEFIFRTHNVKIDKFIIEKDLPMMFLAHYDSLSDDIKADRPLDVSMLKMMNEKVTAQTACRWLSLPDDTIKAATHIKISGTTVIVCDDFPLALHLQFTNTAKDTQAIYTTNPTQSIKDESTNFVLTGNVNILHKNTAKSLISLDFGDEEYIIPTHDGYTRLPNAHALATTHTLNTLKDRIPQALAYVQESICQKVMAHHQMQQEY
ncbi:hypothetical protein [Moraxella sp. ZY200743]|uniref:hypothetical protein n=1 Tax=Moraxella sp. ZY200743 TaxID=2911970 RepID=UPI003D7C8F5B